MMSENRTINDEIQDMIDNSIKGDILYPCRGRVVNIYLDGCVDVETNDYGVLLHLPVYGGVELMDIVCVLFRSNDSDDVVVLGDYTGLVSKCEELEGRLSVLEGLVLDSS